MISLNNGDAIRALASVTNVITYSVSGYKGTDVINADGLVTDAEADIYLTDADNTAITDVVFRNTDSSARTITLYRKKSGGTARALLSYSLGVGYSLFTNGRESSICDENGAVVSAFAAHASEHENGGADEISVIGLSGLLADDQHVLDAEVTAVAIPSSATMAENTSIDFEDVLTADGKYTGITMTGVAGATLAFGDLVYLQTADARWELASSDNAAAGYNLRLGICVLAAANDGSATKILLFGTVRADTAFPDLTPGAPVYMGLVAGDVQVAAPTGSTDIVRIVGHGGYTKEELNFAPEAGWIKLV